MVGRILSTVLMVFGFYLIMACVPESFSCIALGRLLEQFLSISSTAMALALLIAPILTVLTIATTWFF